MRHRSLLGALLMIGLVLPLTSCSVTPELTSVTVSPASVTASYTAGLQVEIGRASCRERVCMLV